MKEKHPHRAGNGDWCPQDPEHGRMFTVSLVTQYCPHSAHKGESRYAMDGKTAKETK